MHPVSINCVPTHTNISRLPRRSPIQLLTRVLALPTFRNTTGHHITVLILIYKGGGFTVTRFGDFNEEFLYLSFPEIS